MQTLIDRIKRNNFDYGDVKRVQTDHYRSTSNIDFDHKMQSVGYKRATLDIEKKNDLTKNHFSIGGPSAKIMKSTQAIGFRPCSAMERKEARPMINQGLLNDLRRSHWGS